MKIAPHFVPGPATIAVALQRIEPLLKHVDMPCR
jgi:hypothetical protein